MAISSPEHGFLLVSFADFYLMVGTSKVKLSKLFSSSQPVQQLPNQWQRVPVLDGEIIEASIVDRQSERTV